MILAHRNIAAEISDPKYFCAAQMQLFEAEVMLGNQNLFEAAKLQIVHTWSME